MASHKELQQAIELMQQGNIEGGARMLQVVIKDPQLPNPLRATAYAWLAESQDDLNFKINCLNRALDSDPGNTMIQNRLSSLLAVQPPNPNQVIQRPPPMESPSPQMGGYTSLPNVELPDSQPIDVIKPNMGDSQPIYPPSNTPSQGMPPVNPPNDPRRSTGQFPQSPPPPSNLPPDPRYATGTQPPVNPSSQPNYPPNLPNQAGLPPQAPSRPTQASQHLQQTPPVIGIQEGPNGVGTGVFVTTDGIVATTRFAVGGEQHLRIQLDTGQEFPGQVVRTYPEYDLAFLQVNVTLDRVWPPTQVPVISDTEAFTVVSFNGTTLRGYRRNSKSQLPAYWIPTNIEMAQVSNAGGDAIFDSNNYLLGLLTHNASRETGLTYGLHISHIHALVNQYIRDRQQRPNADYCTDCGSLTYAQQYGGYYCETCGTILPQFEGTERRLHNTPQLQRIYNENLHRPCPNCSAKVGYHDGYCLRCAYDINAGQRV